MPSRFFHSSKEPPKPSPSDALPGLFMQKRAPTLDAAYRDPSLATVSNAIVVSTTTPTSPQDLRALATVQTERFTTIMDEFVKQHEPPRSLGTFDIRGTHSWGEVMTQVSSARDMYDQKAKGKSGIAVRAGRYISSHTDVIDPWLSLIPDNEYSSIVCGALKFVFGAAAAQSDVREKIMDSIESIPDDVEEISACLDRFNGVVNEIMWKKLTEKALKLYVGVLTAVEGMLRWLDESAFLKLFKSLMLQTAYGSNVKGHIDNMKKLSTDLRRYAQTCAEDVLVGVSKQTGRLETLSKQHLSITAMNSSRTEEVYQQGGEMIEMIQDLDAKLESNNKKAVSALTAAGGTLALLDDDLKALRSTLQESDWRKMQFEKKMADIGQTLEAVMELQKRQEVLNLQLQAQQQEQQLHASTQINVWIQAPLPPPQNQFTREQLQTLMGVDFDRMESALDVVLSSGHAQGDNLNTGGLTKRVLQIRRFREWMQSDNSQILLLRSLSENWRPVTALSSFCAALVSSLRDVEPAAAMHYFCGVVPLQDGRAPLGRHHLLRSLIVQLLEAWPADRAFMLPAELGAAQLSSWEFGPLWQLFMATVMSAPGMTVFCVIDGALRYPDEEEVGLVVQGLRWLAQVMLGPSAGTSVKLKLLVTSPTTPALMQEFREDDRVILSTDLHDRLGLNDGWGQQSLGRGLLARERSRSPMRLPMQQRLSDDGRLPLQQRLSGDGRGLFG